MGLRAYGASFGVIRRARLRYLYAISLLFTLAFTVLGAWGIGWLSDQIISALHAAWPAAETSEDGAWNQAMEWLRAGGEMLIRGVVFVALWWLKIKLMKYIVIVFLGPVMAWTSEQVEAHLTGEDRGFDWATWWREFVRGLRSAALLFVWEMSLTFGLFALSALSAIFAGPLAVLFAPVLAVAGFLVGSWFYGASVLDFVWERRGFGARAGLRQTAQSHGLALGLGIPFAVWMVIPGIGWFLAPIIAPVTAAAAAAIAIHRREATHWVSSTSIF